MMVCADPKILFLVLMRSLDIYRTSANRNCFTSSYGRLFTDFQTPGRMADLLANES